MEKDKILEKIQDIFCDVLDNEEIILSNETCADDIEEWDSLSNIQLIVAVERAFGIRFSSQEIMGWANVGEIINCIKERCE